MAFLPLALVFLDFIDLPDLGLFDLGSRGALPRATFSAVCVFEA